MEGSKTINNIEDLTTKDTVEFEPIPGKVVRPPDKVLKDMSSNQRYALEMALWIIFKNICLLK